MDDSQRWSDANVNDPARRNVRPRVFGNRNQIWRLRYHRCRVEGTCRVPLMSTSAVEPKYPWRSAQVPNMILHCLVAAQPVCRTNTSHRLPFVDLFEKSSVVPSSWIFSHYAIILYLVISPRFFRLILCTLVLPER